MIKQYPHYLFAIVGGDSVQDDDGNWIPSESNKEFLSMCREETNGRGAQVQIAGGTFHIFTSLIQLPKSCKIVNSGAAVFVSNNADGSDERIKGEVLKFDDGQLHNRLWV